MLTIELLHLCKGIGGNTGTEDRDVGSEPCIGHMVRCRCDPWQRSVLGIKGCSHPYTNDAHIALHVHTVGAIVRAGDVSKVWLVVGSNVSPQGRLHLTSDCLHALCRSIVSPQCQTVQVNTAVCRRVVFREGIELLEEVVDVLGPVGRLLLPVGTLIVDCGEVP